MAEHELSGDDISIKPGLFQTLTGYFSDRLLLGVLLPDSDIDCQRRTKNTPEAGVKVHHLL